MGNAERIQKVDVAVIGAGTAGLAAYRAARAAGASALTIEAGQYGTTCARVGCMPSKLLVAAAEAAHHARTASPFGVHAEVRVDGREVMDRVRRERDRFVGFVVEGVEQIPEADRLRGRARFLAPGRLAIEPVVDGDETRIVEARAVVVATGSSPHVPQVFDAVRDRVIVNDDVFSWRELPRSVAVFGAGVVGLELGQALARLGVRVRVFGRGGSIGPLTDPRVKEATVAALRRDLRLDPDARVHEIRLVSEGGEVGVAVRADGPEGETTETFDYALVSAGRRPNLGLGLDQAGVRFDESGKVLFDRRTMLAEGTSVFVAGDANDDVPLLHEAADEGRIAGENAARFPDVALGHRRSLLGVVFTDPQLAVVGATHASLLTSHGADELIVGEVDFGDQGRSRVMLQNHGRLHVYASARTGRLLGAEMAGPRAENIGHLLAWAHQQELTVDEMLTMPFYHPVVEEGLRTALRDASAKRRDKARR